MGNGSPKVKKTKSQSKIKIDIEFQSSLRSMEEAFYRKVNPQREQEIMDSRMIQEDRNAIANLSPHAINKQFNPNKFMQSLGRKDEMSEI